MPNLPSKLAFASLLSYTPHPETPEQHTAREVMLDLKQGRRYRNPPISITQLVAKRMLERVRAGEFPGLFGGEVTAVPVPSSSLKKPGSLSVPRDLAMALQEVGLVGEVLDLVERHEALPKSATSRAEHRSKAADHHRTLTAVQNLLPPSAILLVDDVVTRGATLLGTAARIQDAYPGVAIRAFAAMRTMSEPKEFKALLDPAVGAITLVSGGGTRRVP